MPGRLNKPRATPALDGRNFFSTELFMFTIIPCQTTLLYSISS